MPNSSDGQLIDKRRRGWFWDYNDVFSSNLSPYSKLVRLYLARCADKERQAWPSYSKMAKDCGISRDSVKRAVEELVESGWIVKSVQIQDGEYLPNHYHLCDPPSNTAIKDDEKGGGCSQRLPCRVATGGIVGALSTQVGAQATQVDAHSSEGMGAHSAQVGAETDCNNTHEIIPMEIQQQQPISDHRSIVDQADDDQNVVVVDRSIQAVLSTDPGERQTPTQINNGAEKKEIGTRPESDTGELTGKPIWPEVEATLSESAPSRDQLDKIVALIKDTAGIKFTLDAAQALFYAGKGDMDRVCKALKGAGAEYRRRKGGKDRVHNEMGWFANAVVKGFVPTLEDKYQDISIT